MARGLRVLLAGGGSGGSATPLLAVAERLQDMECNTEFLFVGTSVGPERSLVEEARLPFVAVPSGKLRRYWSWQNLIDPVRLLGGLAASARAIRRFQPDVALGAGGFGSVPPLTAAALMGVPIHIHQQDAIPGLANRILAPLASSCSVSLPTTLRHFPAVKTVLMGNPVRPSVLRGDAENVRVSFGLELQLPLLLVTGGGTGALALNRLVAQAAPMLVEHCQIIHLTGAGRGVPHLQDVQRYLQLDFVTSEMADLLSAATVVVSRCGMGILSELAVLGKPAVLIPMPRSHQLANAATFASRGAAIIVEQEGLTPETLASAILSLLAAPDRLAELGGNMRAIMPSDAGDRLARRLLELTTPAEAS